MNGLIKKLRDKVLLQQNGVMTFADNLHRSILTRDECSLTAEEKKAKYLFEHLDNNRFITYAERKKALEWPADDVINRAYSQGVFQCMQWKGQPIFKTPVDLSILSMLVWELKPGCIVEIGSGNGSSAEYLSDITKLFNLDTVIVSFDNNPVNDKKIDRVIFSYGDCNHPTTFNLLTKYIKNNKPTLFIEDAHFNVAAVVKHLLTFSKPGDYFFIEDTAIKQHDISEIYKIPGLLLDTKILDFFGYNCSSSIDGIFKVTVDFLGRPLYNESTLTLKGT